jgi:hypothetical protein
MDRNHRKNRIASGVKSIDLQLALVLSLKQAESGVRLALSFRSSTR